MSYTGTGASELERPILQRVEQGTYPQESTTRVTSAENVLLPAPQSGGWVTRTGLGSHTEQPQRLPVRQVDQVDACTTQTTEKKAQAEHSARKRKECPTEEEKRYNRSRYMECTQTTLAVQASLEADSTSATVNAPSRPIRESGWIQHQGQPRDRTLMAHGKSSTGYSSDILEAGQMAASLRKVPVTASIMTTSRGAKENEGEDETQSLYLKQRGSGGIGGVG